MGRDDKVRRTVTIDPELDEELKGEANASALAQALFRHYYSAGRTREAAAAKRIAEKESEVERINSEIARLKSQKGRLRREIERLRDYEQSLEDDELRQINSVVGLIEEGAFDADLLVVDNELVQQRAQKAGMDPETFIVEVEDQL